LARPNPNAAKFFSAVELFTLLSDREWLNEATKTIGQFWRQKNARRHGLTKEQKPKTDRPLTAVRFQNFKTLKNAGLKLGACNVFVVLNDQLGIKH